MNRSHESLIKLARFQVEELQRQMAELDRARERLRTQVDKLDQEVAREQKVAASNPDAAQTYGAYAAAVKGRKENLLTSVAEVDRQAETLREELQDAFEQLKKYELLEERRLAMLAERERAAEQAELDEIAQRRRA